MDLSDDERAALDAACKAWVANGDIDYDVHVAIWRAAGRYYLEMAAKICDGVLASDSGDCRYCPEVCAKAIRRRIEGTTA